MKIIPCIIGLGYVGLPVFISLNRNLKLLDMIKIKLG